MAVLVDWQIRARLGLTGPHRLVLDPFVDYGECPPDAVSYGLTSAGYDLRVGLRFLVFNNLSGQWVDPKNFQASAFTPVQATVGQAVLIPPNSFALAETIEYLEMPSDVVGDIWGKSRLARCGYVMPTTPIEPSWRGKITLEIGNLSPLPMVVYAGEGIGQLRFTLLDQVPEKTYDQKPNRRFQDQAGLTGPMGVGR